MNTTLSRPVAALVVALFAAGASHGQTPHNLDVVPEKMPFETPYGAPITLERADAVLTAAVAESRKRGWMLACAIMDSGGNLVSFKRMDNTQLASVDLAIHKARTAVKFRRETKVFETNVQTGNPYQLTLDDVIAARGGIPIVEGGRITGSIGCSGGTGSQDEVVAKAAMQVLK